MPKNRSLPLKRGDGLGSYSKINMLDKKNILGVGITNASTQNILEYVIKSIEENTKNYYITTPNPEMVVYATRHPEFRSVLNNAKLALCDGTGIVLAGLILGKPLIGRTTGVELMKKLCEKVAKRPITVGFLGARGNIAQKTAECLKSSYPELKVTFADAELSSKDYAKFPKTDILFLAYGFPKQEQFMSETIGHMPVRVMMGVGGAFDYVSGTVKRAPRFLQTLGLEWLFRLVLEPWRARRQLSLLTFIGLVLKERFQKVR